MRKALLVIILFSVVLIASLFAGDSTTSTVTIASVVEAPIKENPSIIISFVTPDIATTVETTGTKGEETTAITGLDLTENGSLSFSLMTSEEITVTTNSTKLNLQIEIVAEGFHLYDYDYTEATVGSVMNDSKIKERNAVPLLSTTPEINIPQFYGSNENVVVNHAGGAKNAIEVQFNKGTTKANLVLGSFDVEWEGKSPLDAGIYKAKVSVVYSTP